MRADCFSHSITQSKLPPDPLTQVMASSATTTSTAAIAAPLGNYAHLLPPSWKRVITDWLDEDTPSFDYGGFVVGEGQEEATLWGKSEVRSCSR